MAARVLAFRSATPAGRPQTAGALATAPRAYERRSPHPSPKVLTMSKQKRHRATNQLPSAQAVLARIEAELAEGYIEVEPEGITPREFFALYLALVREGCDHLLGGVRSLFRLNPAH